MEYKNKYGTVEKIEADRIIIDGDAILTDTNFSIERVNRSGAIVGDRVEFNFKDKTGELIFLRVLERGRGKFGTFRVFDYSPGDRVVLPESRGEMAQLSLASHDACEEWSDGDHP